MLVLVLILATSSFYAAAGLGLPYVIKSLVRLFRSVQLLDTKCVIGGVEFRIDCLRHRIRKLFLSSSTVVSVSIIALILIFQRRSPVSQQIISASHVPLRR